MQNFWEPVPPPSDKVPGMSLLQKETRLALEFCLITNKGALGNKQKAGSGDHRKGNGLRTESSGDSCSDHSVTLTPGSCTWLFSPKHPDFIATGFPGDVRNPSPVHSLPATNGWVATWGWVRGPQQMCLLTIHQSQGPPKCNGSSNHTFLFAQPTVCKRDFLGAGG